MPLRSEQAGFADAAAAGWLTLRNRAEVRGRAELIEELEELFSGQTRLPQDRGQGPALDGAVLGDHDHPSVGVAIDGVASLDPHTFEALGPEGTGDIADGQVRQGRAHAAGSANDVTSGVLDTWPAGSSTSSR